MPKTAQKLESDAADLREQAVQWQGVHDWLYAFVRPTSAADADALVETQLAQYRSAIKSLHQQVKQKVRKTRAMYIS